MKGGACVPHAPQWKKAVGAAVAAALLLVPAAGCAGGSSGIVGLKPVQSETATPEPAVQPDPLADALETYAQTQSAAFSAAVRNTSTGETFVYNGDGRYLEASLVKVPILLTLLRQASEADRDLDETEVELATAMIEQSDNTATAYLYDLVGGAPELARTYELLGVEHTEAGEVWGANETSVEDQLRISEVLLSGADWLDGGLHRFAVQLMEGIAADQYWGLTAGTEGADAEVALKNGWLQDDENVWNVGSTGFIRSDGTEYSISVLTSGSLTLEDGISVVEGVARLINQYELAS